VSNLALKDILAALNTIRAQVLKADAETKMAALEAMLSSSVAIVAMAKKLTQPKVIRKPCRVPKPPVPKRQPQQRQVPQMEPSKQLPQSPKNVNAIPLTKPYSSRPSR